MSAAELRKAAEELREFWPNAPVEPQLAGPLAEWLDDEARAAGYHENRVIPSALKVARLINGGAE